MTHPEELLAGYVDTTLSAQDRAAVEAHLAECTRCSREVLLADGARRALRSLDEVPAPPGVASKALEEAAGAHPADIDGTPRWYRIGGAVAAVAAALLVFTLVVPHIGNGGGTASDAGQRKNVTATGPVSEGALAAANVIQVQHMNYDDGSLSALTSSYRSATPGPTGFGAAGSAQAAPVSGTQAQTDKALHCVAKSAPDQGGQLQSLIRARFKGTPAYLAVFFEGPGAGQPADTVTVWVLAAKDCRILSFSSGQL